MKIKDTKIKIIIISVVFAIVAAFLLLSENGLIKYWKLKGEINTARTKIDSSKVKIKQLDTEIDSLKTNTFKIEKVAREKFNIKRKGEKVIIIKEKE